MCQFAADGLAAEGVPASIMQKVTAFIYNYQVIISESERKIRLFSPLRQQLSVD